MAQPKPRFRASSTRAERDEETIATYRRYLRVPLPESAAILYNANQDLLAGINRADVLRDAEKGIK